VKALPLTPELLRVARRVVWFEEPETALSDPVRFLAHVMVFGTIQDLTALGGVVFKDDFARCWSTPHPGCSTLAPGPTGTSSAAATRPRPCRSEPGSRSLLH